MAENKVLVSGSVCTLHGLVGKGGLELAATLVEGVADAEENEATPTNSFGRRPACLREPPAVASSTLTVVSD